ncbi:MAG TPA: hypothetical protein VGN09_13435 [Vicinamibacteria bacterium]
MIAAVAVAAFLAGFAAGTATWILLTRRQQARPAPTASSHRPREALKSAPGAPSNPVAPPFKEGLVSTYGVSVDDLADHFIQERVDAKVQAKREETARLLKAGQALAAERAAPRQRRST